ncbi:hypothetical protein DOW38_20205 [Salmonella enterica subsp. enterica serovar Baildon]|nr:hypothetical protein [Salmonella enterica subsp. enterica serovar Baildon]
MNNRNTFKEETLLARKHLAQLESLARKLDTLNHQWEEIVGKENPGYAELHPMLNKLKRNIHHSIGGWQRNRCEK